MLSLLEQLFCICTRSSGDRAMVSGAMWRGFESLRVCLYERKGYKTMRELFEKIKDIYKRYEKQILLSIIGVLLFVLFIVMFVGYFKSSKPKKHVIKADAYEHVNELVDRYYEAKASGNIETLQSIQVPFLDTDAKKLSHESELIDDYRNIVCYTHTKGITKNIYVVFAYYEIKFPDVETLVPGMETLVICKDSEGKWYINNDVQTLSEQDRAALDYTLEDLEVIALFDDVETSFAIALSSDEGVKQFFESLGGDSTVYLNNDSPQDQTASAGDTLTLGALDGEKVAGPVNKDMVVVINIDLFETADESATVIDYIPVGTVLSVSEFIENNGVGYAKVTFEDKEGYVEWDYVYSFIEVNDKVTGTCNYYTSCSNVIQPMGTLSEGVEYERTRYFGNGCSEIKVNDTLVYTRNGEL